MGFKLQYLCAAAYFLCLMKAVNIRAQCTQPSFESRNAILSGSHPWTQSFPDGSSATFECVIGHKPVHSRASKSVTCQGTQWTNLELDCIRKSCGSPKEFANGKYDISGILFGDKITVVCDKGYILDGQMKDRLCRDGGWDGRDPGCQVVKCAAPPTIENGQLEDKPLDSYDYSQVVSYRCNHGFSLTGCPTLRCSQDGTFKPDPPKCLDVCQKPDIPHAIRIGGKSPPYELGNFIEYKCEDGYTMKGEGYILCSEKGWSPEPPQCIAMKCAAPPAIENGQLEDKPLDSYDYSQVVSYRCNHGFSLIGSPTLRCSQDGTFKPDPPKCLAAKCQAPPIIENGQIESVSYKCNSGFFLIGSSQLYLSEDGNFKPDPPKCLDVCPTPEIPHAIRIGGKSPRYKPGYFIEYKCEDGYTMKGGGYIVCTLKGWIPEPPKCIEHLPDIKYLPLQQNRCILRKSIERQRRANNPI